MTLFITPIYSIYPKQLKTYALTSSTKHLETTKKTKKEEEEEETEHFFVVVALHMT